MKHTFEEIEEAMRKSQSWGNMSEEEKEKAIKGASGLLMRL